MNTEFDHSLLGHDEADWLESVLLASRPGAIPDVGFSARVMQRLPGASSTAQVLEQLQIGARKDRRFEWFTLIGAMVGCALAHWGSNWPGPDDLASTIANLLDLRPVPIQALAPWLASLFSAAVLAYVLQQD